MVPVFRPLDFLFRLGHEQGRALASGNDERGAVAGLGHHLEDLSGGVVGVIDVAAIVEPAVAAEAVFDLGDKVDVFQDPSRELLPSK